MHSPRSLGALLLACIFVTSHSLWADDTKNCRHLGSDYAPDFASLSLAGIPVLVELAFTESHRRCGLMHRDYLPANGGMLFLYPSPRPLNFWMRDTALPLDLAFIAENGRILAIHTLKPFDRKWIRSPIPVRYAVEMGEGWFKSNGVGIGDYVDIARMRIILDRDN